jgi:hypothetical protein
MQKKKETKFNSRADPSQHFLHCLICHLQKQSPNERAQKVLITKKKKITQPTSKFLSNDRYYIFYLVFLFYFFSFFFFFTK